MARRPKVKIHDDKKMETVIDFGEVNIVTSWDDVTLQQMCDFWKLSEEKKQLLEEDKAKAKKDKTEMPDESLEKYNVTDKDILKTFSDISEEKIDVLPVELYEHLMGQLAFVVTPYEQKKPSKYITIDGTEYVINDMESLKVKEYKDADGVLRTNRFDYPSLLAILCRRRTGTKTDNATGLSWDVNEEYTSEFANRIFDARREMFAKLPIADAMPLVSFFLLKGLASSQVSQRYLQIQGHRLRDFAESIGNSLESMELPIWSRLRVKRTLKKLRKQIDDIC